MSPIKRSKKICIVPCCANDSAKNPEKIFISLPKSETRQDAWFKAMNVLSRCDVVGQYVCEDHFILSEDVENWMHFKLAGNKCMMKPDVVPHRNLNASTKKVCIGSQLTDSDRKRKAEYQKATECTRKYLRVRKGLFPDKEVPSVVPSCSTDEDGVLVVRVPTEVPPLEPIFSATPSGCFQETPEQNLWPSTSNLRTTKDANIQTDKPRLRTVGTQKSLRLPKIKTAHKNVGTDSKKDHITKKQRVIFASPRTVSTSSQTDTDDTSFNIPSTFISTVKFEVDEEKKIFL